MTFIQLCGHILIGCFTLMATMGTVFVVTEFIKEIKESK